MIRRTSRKLPEHLRSACCLQRVRAADQVSKRIGILTGGGDCPGLNGVIRAVALHASNTYGYEVVGSATGSRACTRRSTSSATPSGVASSSARRDHPRLVNRANLFVYPITLPDGRAEIMDVSARA